jgi:hypothetical protein
MVLPAAAKPAIGRLVQANGLSIYSEVHGQGQPLLLHSGVWAGTQSWDRLLPHLTGYRVVTFDPPGIGRSPRPAHPLTMRDLASVGTALLDGLGIGGNRIELCNAGARLVLAPDWQPVDWTEADRAKGQAWGLKTIESFHTHGTPPIDGPVEES